MPTGEWTPHFLNNMINVTKCVCFDITFEVIKKLSIEDIKKLPIGTKCGLCKPYIQVIINDIKNKRTNNT